MSVYTLTPNGKESWKMIQDDERIWIATKNNGWPRLGMYYPPAKFGDDMYSALCYRANIHIHTHPHPYRPAQSLIALLMPATMSQWVISSNF